MRDNLNGTKLDAVYCSDLKRALATARIITSGHNAPVMSYAELREMDFGNMEGRSITECFAEPMNARWWENRDPYFTPPGGESVIALTERVSQFIQRVDLSSEANLMVVAHGGSVRALICVLLGLDARSWWQFQISHTSLSVICTTPQGGAVLSLLNDISHLGK